MENSPGKIQIINANNDKARCRSCGCWLELGGFSYAGEVWDYPTYRLEKNVCRCGKEFLFRYDFFNKDGHINSEVFNGDINDSSYRWQSLMTEEQLMKIEKHLSGCLVCKNRHDEVILEDAVFGSFIRSQPTSVTGAFNG
jgi:hypothetical protein